MMTALNMEESLPGYYRRASIYSVKDLESPDYSYEEDDKSLVVWPKQNGQNFNRAFNNDESQDKTPKEGEQKEEEGGRDTWSLGRLEEYKELQKQGPDLIEKK